MRVVDKAGSSYPNNSSSLFQWRGEDPSHFEHLTTKRHVQTNRSGVVMTSLLLMDEP